MNDLSVRIDTDDEQVRTRLCWLLEFLEFIATAQW